MAKFDFDKPVASFSWYLQNGSADDKRGNRLHVGTGQKAQIYFEARSAVGFVGNLPLSALADPLKSIGLADADSSKKSK